LPVFAAGLPPGRVSCGQPVLADLSEFRGQRLNDPGSRIHSPGCGRSVPEHGRHREQIGREKISSYNLTGYSLGGTQSAFLAELDTREKRFGFDKVMLLNPAVSLLTSATILDHLLSDNVADRAEAARVVSRLVSDLSEAYRGSDEVNFGDDFLCSPCMETAPFPRRSSRS
jgi:hypothetical protein